MSTFQHKELSFSRRKSTRETLHGASNKDAHVKSSRQGFFGTIYFIRTTSERILRVYVAVEFPIALSPLSLESGDERGAQVCA